jgi:hypothetical protein
MPKSPIPELRAAKQLSDERRYPEKTEVLRKLILERPDEFRIDSADKGVYGVTHIPSGFRIHMPREAYPIKPHVQAYLAGYMTH